MTRRIVIRIAQSLFVLWAAYTVSFLLLNALPGDGIMIKFEDPEMGLSPEQIATIRDYYRVDDPLLIQYLHALLGALRGDFGYSIENAVPVLDRIEAALPSTVVLAGLAFVVAVVLAVGIALAAVYARSDRLRNAISGVPSLFISIPAFWLGIVLIQTVSFQLGWVPVIGGEDWQKLILPVLTLAVPVSAPLAQILLRTLDDVGTSPFIAVVEAKGASRWWTLTRAHRSELAAARPDDQRPDLRGADLRVGRRRDRLRPQRPGAADEPGGHRAGPSGDAGHRRDRRGRVRADQPRRRPALSGARPAPAGAPAGAPRRGARPDAALSAPAVVEA